MSAEQAKSAQITWRTYLLPPLHPEGPGFVAVFALAALILYLIWTPLGLAGLGATVWCFYFFRDPDRVTPARDGLVISPADGIVQMIVDAAPPPELGMDPTPRTRISVFMSVFDCHVNRAPIAGSVVKEEYTPGKFLNATLDKASEDNERQALLFKTESGADYAMVQIAGLVARRIRCDARAGQQVVAGQRVGLIRFGSRVDVYLPAGVAPLVAVGQKAVAGETVLADATSNETARRGEVC
ncbi:MAG: phosphatidylserine decarboxylase [Alphaproteobacteria bacterium]|nr:phosphatidylserine decarboxylase [Alphaproteobacteria bacterium]